MVELVLITGVVLNGLDSLLLKSPGHNCVIRFISGDRINS